jgi:hypothetical protein
MGVVVLRDVAYEIEKKGRGGDLAGAAGYVTELQELVAALDSLK